MVVTFTFTEQENINVIARGREGKGENVFKAKYLTTCDNF